MLICFLLCKCDTFRYRKSGWRGWRCQLTKPETSKCVATTITTCQYFRLSHAEKNTTPQNVWRKMKHRVRNAETQHENYGNVNTVWHLATRTDGEDLKKLWGIKKDLTKMAVVLTADCFARWRDSEEEAVGMKAGPPEDSIKCWSSQRPTSCISNIKGTCIIVLFITDCTGRSKVD
jgi:hypothetical protein